MKIEIDKDGIILTSEDMIDFAFLDYWTRGKEVYLPSYGIRDEKFDDRKREATLKIRFREPQTASNII